MPRSTSCASTHSDQDLRCLLLDCINGNQMPGWHILNALADLNLHILRMLEDTFRFVAARLWGTSDE